MSHVPPDRAHLAAMLRVLAGTRHTILRQTDRKTLAEYVDIAEDTIAAQARMLVADVAALARSADVRDENASLRERNAILRKIARQAVAAALDDDVEAIRLIRADLERIS